MYSKLTPTNIQAINEHTCKIGLTYKTDHNLYLKLNLHVYISEYTLQTKLIIIYQRNSTYTQTSTSKINHTLTSKPKHIIKHLQTNLNI